jgi:ferredoxin-NADP reductase
MPQKLRCQVSEIQPHGERVYSLILRTESPAPHFLPGQFLHLALDEYDPGDFWPESRSFSIASAPTELQLLRITYAVKGQFTARMEAELHVGRHVWVKMPYGEFTIDQTIEVCLLAGGTGVTAFTAFLTGLPMDHPHHVHLFYGARRPDLLIYRPLLQAAAQRCTKLRVHFLAEQDTIGTDCLPGRIDAQAVFNHVPEPCSLIYYLSGPPDMIHTLTDGLLRLGLNSGQILADAWE